LELFRNLQKRKTFPFPSKIFYGSSDKKFINLLSSEKIKYLDEKNKREGVREVRDGEVK
jgi:hypothetical protein